VSLPEPSAPGLGRLLIGAGLLLLVVGAGLLLSPRVPWLGRLPGDIHYQKGNFTFYFPVATLLLVNLLIFVLLRLFKR
jgi:hypothetical protein